MSPLYYVKSGWDCFSSVNRDLHYGFCESPGEIVAAVGAAATVAPR